MAGSSFGTLFKVTTFGESHGIGLGAVLEGCPAGLSINEEMHSSSKRNTEMLKKINL